MINQTLSQAELSLINQDELEIARRKGTPTQKTIARITGLSVAAISRALSGDERMNAGTRQLIKNIAEILGYRPNRVGVRLKTGKTFVLAFVLTPDRDGLANDTPLVHALSDNLFETNYHLIIAPQKQGADPVKAAKYIVESGSADGIILSQTSLDDPRVAYLESVGFPFVTFGRTDGTEDHPYYDHDHEAFAALAVAELAKRGRKNLVLLSPPTNKTYSRLLQAGFKRAAGRNGGHHSVVDLGEKNASVKEASDIFEAYIERHGHPEGIVAPNTKTAIVALKAMGRLKLTLGQDFDMVARGANWLNHIYDENIITAVADLSVAGEFLAKALIQLIEDPSMKPAKELEPPALQN